MELAETARGSMRVNLSQFIKLVLAIALAQAIYWYGIDRYIFQAPPPAELAKIELTGVELAKLAEPTLADAARAKYAAVELPFTDCCARASFAVRMHFHLDTVPEKGLGVLSTLQVDNYILRANGSTIVAQGRMVPGRQSFHGQKTFITGYEGARVGIIISPCVMASPIPTSCPR